MDALRAAIGLTPLAAYLFILGLINLSRRPVLHTGVRDLAALGVALVGLVFVGPIELLMPTMLVAEFGWLAWALALVVYSSGWTLLVLSTAPRLVAYNIDAERFRLLVAEVALAMDADTHWAGDSVVLPRRGVQARMESFPVLRNSSLVSNGPRQDFAAWAELEKNLRHGMESMQVQRNPRGGLMLGLSVAILAALIIKWARDPQFAQSFVDLMGL
ncbi:MAG: hypothetical protein MPJ50_13770 [Pirellulales bacterium]|nr:hypothetical protein [Pirellulales bacterium]